MGFLNDGLRAVSAAPNLEVGRVFWLATWILPSQPRVFLEKNAVRGDENDVEAVGQERTSGETTHGTNERERTNGRVLLWLAGLRCFADVDSSLFEKGAGRRRGIRSLTLPRFDHRLFSFSEFRATRSDTIIWIVLCAFSDSSRENVGMTLGESPGSGQDAFVSF